VQLSIGHLPLQVQSVNHVFALTLTIEVTFCLGLMLKRIPIKISDP
jgi:hypothetical protein